jgi:hypothetical protein
MPEPATTDYITKTEAARLYRRSERSISRDITNAVKFGDGRVLQHVELRLEDGTRRAGTELTIEEIVELRDRGLNPTWLLQTVWLKKTYGRRDEPPQDATSPTFPDLLESTGDRQQPLPEDLEQRAAVLAAQNEALRQSNVDLRNQADRLETELDRRAEERREENELQKQNNVLMQQVYNLLSKMQESTGPVSILPPSRSLQFHSETGSTVNTKPVINRKENQHSASKSTARTKASRKRSATPARQPQPKQQPTPAVVRKRSPTSKPEPIQPPTDRLHRWFPTFLGPNRQRKK